MKFTTRIIVAIFLIHLACAAEASSKQGKKNHRLRLRPRSPAAIIATTTHNNATTTTDCGTISSAEESSRCLQEQQQQQQQQQSIGPKQSSILNPLIEALLPTINAAIQSAVDDPLTLDLTETVTLGSLTVPGCSDPVSAGFNFELDSITGLSTLFIETLEVVSGTESITGCLNQPWSATFNMAVASTGTLSIDDLVAAFQASICGLNLNEGVGGNLVTMNATLAGLVDLTGNLCAGIISIDSAQILDTLTVGWDTITADLTGVPAVFSSWISEASTTLSSSMQDQLVNVVEPRVRPIIQEQLDGATAFAPAIAVPIQAAAIVNQAEQRIQSIFDAGAQLLGGRG